MLGLALLLTACGAPEPPALAPATTATTATAGDQQSGFRIRADFGAPLNADQGWAADLDTAASVAVEQPFRIRFEVESGAQTSDPRRYRLQSRRNGGAWTNVDAADFPYPEGSTPPVSIVSTTAYEPGASTDDLLATSNMAHAAAPGGIALQAIGPEWSGKAASSEWEWPLVIRRVADGPVFHEAGDRFEFRMADAGGCPLGADANPEITVTVPERLLAGTFVETPARLGPWQAANGDLYFMMEPSETDNVLMVVKSTDGGLSWAEVDGANRPAIGDVEGFASALHRDTIYMLHQTSDEVLLHAFRTSDHPERPDTWAIRDKIVMEPEEPPTQVADLAVRSDGSIVAVYGGPKKIHYKIRDSEGAWGEQTIVDADSPRGLSGPQVVRGKNDVVHLAYTGNDGTAWYRRIQPDGALSAQQPLATGLGTAEGDVGSILPLAYQTDTDTVTLVYRLADGHLWERHVRDAGALSEAVQITQQRVVQNSVDSDQTGADLIADGARVHLLFIEQDSGSVYHAQRAADGTWQTATLEIDGINAQWVRGNRIRSKGGAWVYGYVYDAGSNGGSGFNRYAEVELPAD